jgi:hypothetical protein
VLPALWSCLAGASIGLLVSFSVVMVFGLLREDTRGRQHLDIPLDTDVASLVQLISLLVGSHAGPMGVLFAQLVIAGLVGSTIGAWAGAEGLTTNLNWRHGIGAAAGMLLGMAAPIALIRALVRW